eukprot:scaffold2096_cov221-Pinguiococcus_pyrenoidosus.AAC.2
MSSFASFFSSTPCCVDPPVLYSIFTAYVCFHASRSLEKATSSTELLVDKQDYGGMRSDPSSRMVSPFMYSLPRRKHTVSANSEGSPSRCGKGTVSANSFRTFSGKPVENR